MLRHVDCRNLQCILAILLSIGFASTAFGQEVSKMWTTGGLGSAPYLTERAAQQAIEEDVGTDFEVDEPFKWHVADVKMTSQQVTYYYRMRPVDLIKSEWKHRFVNFDYDSEEQMLQAMKDAYASEGSCPAVQITPGQWRVTSTGPDGSESMLSATHHVLQYFIANGNCVGYSRTPNVYQVREVRCPNPGLMSWSQESQACDVAPWHSGLINSVMTYSTTPVTNQCRIGNPCDLTTGNKTQPENDFDLAWVNFTRYFQSMTSTPKGGFGTNWTHSHNIRLSVDQNSMGLVELDGTHLAFKMASGGYEAMDGSGDWLADVGNGWQLRRAQEVLNFSRAGQLLSRTDEGGATLMYTYDPRGRLRTIKHHTGREIVLNYGVAWDDELISSISTRNGTVVLAAYSYDADGLLLSAATNLSQPRAYHYEDPRFPTYLTGVTSEDGARYSWFAYDDLGRLVCSRHSADCSQANVGVDGVRISYASDGSVVATDARGAQRVYGLTSSAEEGHPRKVTSVDDATGGDVRTYHQPEQDFRRRITSRRNRDGSVTEFSYTTRTDSITGRPLNITTVTEAAGLPSERVTEDHVDLESNRLVLRKTAQLETRISRNARFQPVHISQRDLTNGEIRVTTYSYCEASDVAAGGDCPVLGLLRKMDGPRSDVDDALSFSYHNDPARCSPNPFEACLHRVGDLKSVRNSLGHSVDLVSYDDAGRPVRIKNVDGSVSVNSSDWKGNILAHSRDGVSGSWTYQYRPTGLLQYKWILISL